MAMSKKNYERLAQTFRTSKTKREVKEKQMSYFKEDNPRFDRARFNCASEGYKWSRKKGCLINRGK